MRFIVGRRPAAAPATVTPSRSILTSVLLLRLWLLTVGLRLISSTLPCQRRLELTSKCDVIHCNSTQPVEANFESKHNDAEKFPEFVKLASFKDSEARAFP